MLVPDDFIDAMLDGDDAQQSGQDPVLPWRKALAFKALDLDADGPIVATVTTSPARDPRVPGPLSA